MTLFIRGVIHKIHFIGNNLGLKKSDYNNETFKVSYVMTELKDNIW